MIGYLGLGYQMARPEMEIIQQIQDYMVPKKQNVNSSQRHNKTNDNKRSQSNNDDGGSKSKRGACGNNIGQQGDRGGRSRRGGNRLKSKNRKTLIGKEINKRERTQFALQQTQE